MTEDKHTLSSYSSTRSDQPMFHNTAYSTWPVIKSRPSFVLESSTLYPSPPMSNPLYDESSAVLTSSYHSTFPDSTQLSPTFFWSANHASFTAKDTSNPTPKLLFEHANNKEQHYDHHLDFYRPQNLIEQESYGKFYASNKISKSHSRFKSAGACFSSNRSNEKFPKKCFSPPLPLNSLETSMVNNNLTAESENICKSPFQFQAKLHSPIAMMKKENQKPITYLNRGQIYLLELSTNQHQRGTLTSTISIEFHEPGHRKMEESYWKFWTSQQADLQNASAIRMDEGQSTGIFNVRSSSFSKISFDWHGCFDPKVYIHFHCLSTDFSRIKGVKGIPMRVAVESVAKYDSLPDNSNSFAGMFSKISDNTGLAIDEEKYEYSEKTFCQIKIFRDKGAERKNKDDNRQIRRQMEKVKAFTLGYSEQHPLWPIINQQHTPVTLLNQICSSPETDSSDYVEQSTTADSSVLYTPALTESAPLFKTRTPKRKICEDTSKVPVFKKKRNPASVSICVWFKNHSFSTTSPERIYLESLTADELKFKLSNVLSLDPLRITELLWKTKKSEASDGDNDVLVLVEDTFVVEYISHKTDITVHWEIKYDNHIRLILEFNSK